jgi:7-carboxy-7-deazaguanine synthase
LKLETIMEQVLQYPARHVVLTGGEPMVAGGIVELAAALSAAGKHITIETAGTVGPEGIVCDLASISPKLANSTPAPGAAGDAWVSRHESTRWQPERVREWITTYSFQLKFVLSDRSDLHEVETYVGALGIPVQPADILLMPEGRTPSETSARALWLVELCKERGYRYAPRVHLDLFGNRRGT